MPMMPRLFVMSRPMPAQPVEVTHPEAEAYS
jgi:hypothetical protein